jgi:hypothetical protein
MASRARDNDTLTCLFLVHGMRHAHEEPRVLDGRKVWVTREQVDALAKLKQGDELALAHERGTESTRSRSWSSVRRYLSGGFQTCSSMTCNRS